MRTQQTTLPVRLRVTFVRSRRLCLSRACLRRLELLAGPGLRARLGLQSVVLGRVSGPLSSRRGPQAALKFYCRSDRVVPGMDLWH